MEIDPPLARQLRTPLSFRPEKAGDIDVVLMDALKVTELPRTPAALVANLPTTWRCGAPAPVRAVPEHPSRAGDGSGRGCRTVFRRTPPSGFEDLRCSLGQANWYAGCTRRVLSARMGVLAGPEAPVWGGASACARPLLGTVDRDLVFTIIDAAFASAVDPARCVELLGGLGCRAEQILVAAGIAPTERGEKLDIHGFIRIAEASLTGPRLSLPQVVSSCTEFFIDVLKRFPRERCMR